MICMEVDGMKRVLFKVILPLAFIVVWLDMCYWICLGDNGMNWFQFWIMSGFPFGIQKMLVLLIPRILQWKLMKYRRIQILLFNG